MKAVIKSDFKIFWRSIYLPIIYFLMVGVLNISFILNYAQLFRYASSAMSLYFSRSQQYGLFVFLVLLFVAFEYMQRAKTSDIMETLEGCKKGVIKMFFGKFSVLLSLVLLIFVNIFTYDLIFYLASGLNFWPVLSNIIACDLLNYFFVGLIAVLAGSFFALRFGRVGGYVCILLIGVFSLPFFNYFLGSLSQGSFNLFTLKELLCIQAPNVEMYPDSLYGQAAEFFRWLLISFWMGLIVLGILRTLTRRKGIAVQITSLLLAAACFFSLSYLLNFTGIVRKGNIGSSYVVNRFTGQDTQFYMLEWLSKIETADFQVTSYDLDFSFTDQLNGTAKITVDKKQTKYILTLYHGYVVQSVTDESGKSLAYTRDGDYLDISTDGSIDAFVVTYRGFSTYYYSNDQAVFLPGYFAYYPIPGHCQLFDDTLQRYVPVVDRSEKNFAVTLHGNMTLETSLKEDSEMPGTYRGADNALTILGGLVKEKTEGGVRKLTLPAERYAKTIDIAAVNQKIHEYCDYLGVTEDMKLTENFTIVDTPTIIGLENTVVFSNHVILGTIYTKYDIAAARVIGNSYSSPKKAKLARVLAEYVADPLGFKTYHPYSTKDIIAYIYGGNVRDNLNIKVLCAAEKLGEDRAIKVIYHYLIDPLDNRDPEDFLEEISGLREELVKYAEDR